MAGSDRVQITYPTRKDLTGDGAGPPSLTDPYGRTIQTSKKDTIISSPGLFSDTRPGPFNLGILDAYGNPSIEGSPLNRSRADDATNGNINISVSATKYISGGFDTNGNLILVIA